MSIQFACAVTTAPRQPSLLADTLRSIEAAGFPQPAIFAELASDIEAIDDRFTLIVNHGPAGPWPNFLMALGVTAYANPDADAYCIFQDDILLSRNLAPWLATKWSWILHRPGIISLFTCARLHDADAARSGGGWSPTHDIRRVRLGAQAYIFPAAVAREFIAAPPDSRGKTTQTDCWVARWLRDRNLPMWHHSPSLCQHVGADHAASSLPSPGGIDSCRRAAEFWAEIPQSVFPTPLDPEKQPEIAAI